MAVKNEATEQENSPAKIFDPEAGMDSEGKKANSNQGWADTMARILENQLPGDKLPVLLKYKKIEKRKAEVKEEKITKKLKSQERHAMLEKGRVIPDRSTMDHEKKLQRIATRGVVKLFNAVSKHQKETENQLKSAPTEAKKSKVMESMSKSAFLDMLKSSSDKRRTPEKLKQQETKDKKKTDISSSWNILRDDFMMDAKMKDWNQEDNKQNRPNKKLTNVADHELANGDGIFDNSDDGDNAVDEEEDDEELSDE